MQNTNVFSMNSILVVYVTNQYKMFSHKNEKNTNLSNIFPPIGQKGEINIFIKGNDYGATLYGISPLAAN